MERVAAKRELLFGFIDQRWGEWSFYIHSNLNVQPNKRVCLYFPMRSTSQVRAIDRKREWLGFFHFCVKIRYSSSEKTKTTFFALRGVFFRGGSCRLFRQKPQTASWVPSGRPFKQTPTYPSYPQIGSIENCLERLSLRSKFFWNNPLSEQLQSRKDSHHRSKTILQ